MEFSLQCIGLWAIYRVIMVKMCAFIGKVKMIHFITMCTLLTKVCTMIEYGKQQSLAQYFMSLRRVFLHCSGSGRRGRWWLRRWRRRRRWRWLRQIAAYNNASWQHLCRPSLSYKSPLKCQQTQLYIFIIHRPLTFLNSLQRLTHCLLDFNGFFLSHEILWWDDKSKLL